MTWRTLIRRNLRFHWRAHLGVVLGAAVGSAALIGALVVGDSVRESLREQALERLGNIQYALAPSDRLFRDELAKDIKSFFSSRQQRFFVEGGDFVAALRLQATAAHADGASHANHVQLIGVDNSFATMAANDRFRKLAPDEVLLNAPLASQLGVREGDEVVFRVRKPSGLTRETAIAPRSDATFALRLRVHQVVPTEALGNFNLSASQIAPHNAFVSLAMLQEMAAVPHRANLILMERAMVQTRVSREISKTEFMLRNAYGRAFKKDSGVSFHFGSGKSNVTYNFRGRKEEVYPFENVSHWIWTDRSSLAGITTMVWQLQDTGLDLIALPDSNAVELRTSRVFLDPAAVTAVYTPPIHWLIAVNSRTNAFPERFPFTGLSFSLLTNWAAMVNSNAHPILTYLATLLRAGTNATPYSMVTAAGAPWTPADLRDDEIVVSQWLAEDLQVKPGDEIALSYFLPESGAKLEEATNTFRIRSIVSLEMPWADRTLMPDFPGIEKAESTSEWDAGFPLTYKIRAKDEEYWKRFRGTPKAFITLAAGQKMWGNRFGNLTAIRFPIPTNATTALTPALSPGERENLSPSQGKPKTADSSTASEKTRDAQRLSPLPGGEGQGEGERHAQTNQLETPHVVSYKEALEKKILANLKPEELGLRFEPVREQALKAAAESQDFGGLFLGFSFFLIVAALLLMALLFSLGLEQRAPEIGTLLALGFTPKQVRNLLLREGVALAFIGGVLGAAGGLAFARAMLHGLTTIWRDAVGASALSFHFTAQTLVIGLFASVVVSAGTIWLTLRKFVRRPAIQLLVGEIESEEFKVQSPKSKALAIVALLAALGLAGWPLARGDTANAGAFFGAGALVLVAGLGFASAWLTGMERRAPSRRVSNNSQPHQRAEAVLGAPITLGSLGVRGCARRRKRSLATVGMLACGSFLIVSIGVFRLDANRDATKPSSGTGGFALIGESTMPVVQDLNSQAGRDFFALDEKDLAGVGIVPFRVREGDEASCLNLNRAQKPRLLGVKPEMLAGRFTVAKGDAWKSLISTRLQPGESAARESENRLNGFPQRATSNTGLKPGANEIEIPAIGDANSIQWAMHKKVGDTIDYVDERGQPFKVRIVGAVANSILQGQLIIDEAEFVKRFPGESGYRMFLIDAPSNAVSQVSATLSRAMQDVGLELTPAAQRLAQFNAVQNTYLGTFQVLGGLGLLLGSVGLGIVVLRNVLERRGELAVLLAVGFRKGTLQRLLLIENGALLLAGLALGVVAAAVAVLPALLSPAAQLPYGSLALTLGAVLVNGALWTWAATRWAVRGDLLRALRNE